MLPRSTVVIVCAAVVFGVSFALVSSRSRADEANQQVPNNAWHGEKTNVLWIMIKDWSTDLLRYGTPLIQTANIDKLANEGIR